MRYQLVFLRKLRALAALLAIDDEAVSRNARENSWVRCGTPTLSMSCMQNIDQFDPTKYTLDYEKLAPMDKWILSKLQYTE